MPGNHDAVRPAEPQPTFPEWVTECFAGDNIRFLGNPAFFSLHGVEILAYHGRSFDDWVLSLQELSYETPIAAMRQMLRRRHLTPIYGGKTPIAPEHEDHLVIERVPDIFVTGHVHKVGMERCYGTRLINASTWQAQTSYQKMMNFNPDPARLPIVDLDTLDARILNFYDDRPRVDRAS